MHLFRSATLFPRKAKQFDKGFKSFKAGFSIAATRLKKRNLLKAGTIIAFYRKRQTEFFAVFHTKK